VYLSYLKELAICDFSGVKFIFKAQCKYSRFHFSLRGGEGSGGLPWEKLKVGEFLVGKPLREINLGVARA